MCIFRVIRDIARKRDETRLAYDAESLLFYQCAFATLLRKSAFRSAAILFIVCIHFWRETGNEYVYNDVTFHRIHY